MLPASLLFSFASSVLSEHIPSVQQDARPRSSSFSPSSNFSLFSSSVPGDTDSNAHGGPTHTWAKRAIEKGSGEFIAFACLIPILVILSGIFAGLTLGYMSLDETQLNVLSISGTPKQREYANKIKPIRKNGHLLLVTLLLANMITNETLPVISDPVLGGGVPAVVVSTVLIVLFAEIIPQSICTRHGLYIGAKCASAVRVLIWIFGIVGWPVAKLLEFSLGPHHGIIYRRAELKELIAMHGAENPLGGDLKSDTVTIIGATLDLQDKTVRHAMTPIDRVFMLHIDAKLDYDTLRRICSTGHSRIPVYEEVEVTVPARIAVTTAEMGLGDGSQLPTQAKKSIDGESLVKTKVKKIIGILLVKQCVLLDPEDAVPIRKMRLIKVPFVPQTEPLLGILDRFQEGRSHMAIVSRLSVERAQSVKKEVRKGLSQRLLGAFHGDSSSTSDSSSDSSDDEPDDTNNLELSHASTNVSEGRDQQTVTEVENDGATAGVDSLKEHVKVKFATKTPGFHRRRNKRKHARRNSGQSQNSQNAQTDLEKGDPDVEVRRVSRHKDDREMMNKEKKGPTRVSGGALEQRMPADAVLSKQNAEEYLKSQGIDPAIMPLGIITLEDVLEELIGEEIYDEFDIEGAGHSQSFVPPGAHPHQQTVTKHGELVRKISAPELAANDASLHGRNAESPPTVTPPSSGAAPGGQSGKGGSLGGLAMPRPITLTSLRNIGFLRSRSAPPTPRDPVRHISSTEDMTPPGRVTPTLVGEMDNVLLDTTSTPQDVEGHGRQLPQIVESPSGSEGTSDLVNVAAVTEVASQHQRGFTTTPPSHQSQSQGQSQGQIKAPSPISSPIPKPALVAPAMLGHPKSRSASPAPSLEAAILHSKGARRASAVAAFMNTSASSRSSGGGNGESASPAPSGTATPVSGAGERGRVKAHKGAAFKSSPLTPISADESVVIAEEIKREKERAKERERTT